MSGTWLGEYFPNSYKDNFITCSNCKWKSWEGKWDAFKCPKCGKVDRQKVLDLINTLEIFDYEADGEALYYAYIDLNDENVSTLKKIGLNETQIRWYQDFDDDDSPIFDLTKIVWEYAEWFDGKQFLLKIPDDI